MAHKLTIEFSDGDELALHHDLLDIDVWVRDMIAGKIANCLTRMSQEAVVKLQSGDIDVKTVEAMDVGTLALTLAAQPDYKNRAARDEADAKASEAAAAVQAQLREIADAQALSLQR